MLLLLLLLSFAIHCNSEEVVVGGCEEVSLTCAGSGMVVVHSATFLPLEGDCEQGGTEREGEDQKDLWRELVAVCGGSKEPVCKFSLEREVPESVAWGKGRIQVVYSCEKEVHSYCGGHVEATQNPTYLSSPGYPHFYLGGRQCVWFVRASAGQVLHLEVEDLSLRTGHCKDSLTLLEGGTRLLELCGSLTSPVSVISSSHELEVKMVSSASGQDVYPHRGVLIRYSAQGCPVPGPPSDGHLLGVNSSVAQLSCRPGHVFRSTLSDSLFLNCIGGVWNPQPQHCVSIGFLLQYGNASEVKKLTEGAATYSRHTWVGSREWRLEMFGTAMVGCLLVVSATIALFILFRFRQRHYSNLQEEHLQGGRREALRVGRY